MTSSDDGALPNDAKLPADNQGVSKDFNGSAALSLAAVILGVCIVYIAVLDWRFPYIHQLPVFDLDYITSVTMMWARNWWTEGPWHMLFSMPYAPLSVETARPELRFGMYASWPPGAVVSLYLVAKLTNTEPNITMINWLNVAGHGLIALFLAMSGYVAAGILRRPRIERVALAILAACLVLFPRGPVFFFSQVYTFDTHIVVFYALLVFVATLEVAAASRAAATWCYVAELAILVSGLFVDWLFYLVYAAWFVLRWVGSRSGYGRRLGRNEAIALFLLPLATFATFLTWRMVTPGSIAAQDGVVASIRELLWKLVFRLGDTNDHPVAFRDFFGPFYEAHRAFYWNSAPILILAGFIVCIALFAILFATSRADPKPRRIYFGLLSVFLLSIIPAYAQMIIFKQHTYIHPWAFAKVVVPLAMVVGVFLPLLAVTVFEQWNTRGKSRRRTAWRAAGSLGILAFAAWLGVLAWPSQLPYLLGRIAPDNAVPWLTIHDRTTYSDVVFSPDIEGAPFSMYSALAGKVVYKAGSFADIDPRVSHICEPFNVVVVLEGEHAGETFGGRTADGVVHDGGLTLLRFQNYQGAAKSCPKV
jgi:hypothetical protein